MDKLTGIGANFVGRKNSLGETKTTKKDETQNVTDIAPQKGLEVEKQRKSPEGILNSMHCIGVQNLAAQKVNVMKNDPKLAKRIGEFMANFEKEVEKGLKIIAKDFPSMDETTASMVAAKAALKASEL
jgi:hypothetical protein